MRPQEPKKDNCGKKKKNKQTREEQRVARAETGLALKRNKQEAETV